MKRTKEPFLPAKSNRPPSCCNVEQQFVAISVAVGARTLDELVAELGIPKAELEQSLNELVAAGLIKTCRNGYYPKPAVMIVRAGDLTGDAYAL